jgi:hypothetical protein
MTLPAEVMVKRIPVRVADLTPFAVKHCSRCGGSGERRVSKRGPLGPPMKSGRRKTVNTLRTIPCGCALTLFMRAQKTEQDPATGQLFFAEPILHWSEEGRRLHAQETSDAPTAGT